MKMRVIIKYTLLLFFSGILFFHSAGVNIDSLKNTFIKTPREKKFNDLHDFIYILPMDLKTSLAVIREKNSKRQI